MLQILGLIGNAINLVTKTSTVSAVCGIGLTIGKLWYISQEQKRKREQEEIAELDAMLRMSKTRQ